MKIVYLKPKSTFPFLSSDSLFGAITYALSELYPDKLNDFLKRFEDKKNLPRVEAEIAITNRHERDLMRFIEILNEAIGEHD